MKKSKKIAIYISLFTIIIICTAGLFIGFKLQNDIKMTAIIKDEKYNVSLENKSFGQVLAERYYEKNRAYVIYSPTTDNEDFNTNMKQLVGGFLENFNQKSESTKNSSVLFIDYKTANTNGGSVSMEFDVQQDVDGAIESFSQFATVNISTGKVLSLNDVCRGEFEQKLSLYAVNQFGDSIEPQITRDITDFKIDEEKLYVRMSGTGILEVPLRFIPELIDYPEIDITKPMVALTFDDGPLKSNTNKILDCLEQNNARATFFVLGTRIATNKDTILRAHLQGCEIASHTYNHKLLTSLSAQSLKSEIENVDKEIIEILGINPALVRPPYGGTNAKVIEALARPIIMWSIDTLDWKTRNAQKTVDHIMQNVKDGDIILLHDIHKETVDASLNVIPKLIEKGYQLVTVTELAHYKGKSLETTKYYDITN